MEHKQNIDVTLKVKEIIFDIMNKTHLTGHSREAEGKKNYESASYMQASEDDEASYQIRRSVSNAFASIKVRLGEYLDEEKTTTDNLINEAVDNIDLSEDEFVTSFREGLDAMGAQTDTGFSELKTEVNKQVNNVYSIKYDTLVSDIKVALGYTSAPPANGVTQAIADDGLKEQVRDLYERLTAVLRLSFRMPSNFHKAAVDSLGGGCHQYITNKAIADWFVITNPEEAPSYVTLAEEALDTAKRALYKRARPTRPEYN